MTTQHRPAARGRPGRSGRPALALLLAAGLALAAGSVGSAQSRIRVEDIWARPGIAAGEGGGHMQPGPMAGTSAIYMVIHNDGADADRLTAVEADVARAVELHQTTIEGGMSRMQPVGAIPIPARGKVELRPGGYHVMLIGLRRDLKAGDRFAATLIFERAGRVRLTVEVKMAGH